MDTDLTSNYLGLTLRNPIVASASPLSATVIGVRQLHATGAGAIVLPSLFEEQIRHDMRSTERLSQVGSNSFPEASSYFPDTVRDDGVPHRYLDLIAEARHAVDIPIIASLNGTTVSGWVDYASQFEAAGASAIELNFYRIASSPTATGPEVEADCIALLKAVRARVKIPIAMKLHPHFSAFGAMARQLDAAGADGLVLFNRLYQADIDLVRLAWTNDVALSHPSEIRLGLLWLSQLSGRLSHASLAAGSGVETVDEVLKYLLAGADVVMTASALLRHGPGHIRTLLSDLKTWLELRDFKSVSEIRGLMEATHPVTDTERQERGDYIRSLTGYRGPYVRR